MKDFEVFEVFEVFQEGLEVLVALQMIFGAWRPGHRHDDLHRCLGPPAASENSQVAGFGGAAGTCGTVA